MGRAILLVLSNVGELNGRTGGTFDSLPTERRTGFDVKEAAFVYELLHKQYGLEINLASPEGGQCHIDPLSLKASEHEDEVQSFLTDQCAMAWLKCTDRLGNFDLERFQAVLFVGGPAAVFDFPEAAKKTEPVVQHIWEKGGVVAAIGHGTAALLNIKDSNGESWLRGKTVTANTSEEDYQMGLEKALPFSIERRLSDVGARFRKANKFASNVIVDGRLITAQNRNSTRDWIKQINDKLQK